MFKFLLFSGEFRCAPTFREDFSNCTHSIRETDSDISKISSIYQSNFDEIVSCVGKHDRIQMLKLIC